MISCKEINHILEVLIILTWRWSTKPTSASRWWSTKTSTCRWPTTPSSNTTHSATELWFEVVTSTSLIHTSITTTTLTTVGITITTVAISWGSTSLVSLIPLESTFGGLGCFPKGGWDNLAHVTTRFERLHGL